MKLNEKIKTIRTQKNMTQKELAEKIGIAVNSVSRYETGERIPTYKMIEKIAQALNVSIEDLFNTTNSHNFKKTLVDLKELSTKEEELELQIYQTRRKFLLDMFDNYLDANGQNDVCEYTKKIVQEKYTTPDEE